VEYNHHDTGAKDKDRSDVKEDVVVDAAGTLSDKGRRGGNNNNTNYGGKGGNMDNVVCAVAVLYNSKEEDGGSLILATPEGRTTIGLTMKRARWWMLTSRQMWWQMRLTLCLTRAEEEATTTMKFFGARGQYGQCCWHGGCILHF
jgi:hypothetical protein